MTSSFATDAVRRLAVRILKYSPAPAMSLVALLGIPLWGQSAWPSYPNNSVISVTSGGSVGFGTGSPSGQFQVAGDPNANLAVFMTSPSGYWTSLYLGPTPNSDGAQIASDGDSDICLGTNGALPLVIMASGAVNETLVISAGNVGIGTSDPQNKLSVAGTVQAYEVLVNTGWSDYVFAPDYYLRPLTEVNDYIQENHHLPGIPSEAEVKEKGVSLGDMQSKLLAKIEELTLHMIQAEQQNRDLQQRIAILESSTTKTDAKGR